MNMSKCREINYSHTSNFIETNSSYISNVSYEELLNELADPRTKDVKYVTYAIIMPIILLIGIFGNILHLITLKSKRLRSVPFMYIRAIAIYDSLSLLLAGVFCMKSASDSLSGKFPMHCLLAIYLAHIQLPLMNCLLTCSLFTALVLTVERYRSTTTSGFHQLRVVQFVRRMEAKAYISAAFALSFILHTPMIFENEFKCKNNFLNCTFKPHDFYSRNLRKTYDWFREILCRMIPVVLLAILNAILVKKVHEIKKRRNLLKLRYTNLNELQNLHSSVNNVTEKRITTMMIGITFIYVIGNIPMSVMMILYDDSHDEDFEFQIFRSFANIMEFGNHCLNFYIFCLTSQDYLKTFVRRCRRLKNNVRNVLCYKNSRRESIDSHSTTCYTAGEPSLYMVEMDDDDMVRL